MSMTSRDAVSPRERVRHGERGLRTVHFRIGTELGWIWSQTKLNILYFLWALQFERAHKNDIAV